jgi:hypothetical protein
MKTAQPFVSPHAAGPAYSTLGWLLPTPGWRVILFVLIGVTLLGLAVDVKNTVKHGQIDLRNRVVGARAMIEQKDPYVYRWREGDSVRLLDPLLTPGSTISKTTVTPSVLAAHASFSWLGYREQKFLWLAAQWLCFAVVIAAACAAAPDPTVRTWVLCLGLAFSCTTFWRQHVAAGQIHVLFAAVAAAIVYAARRQTRWTDLAAGALLGVLITFRPQFVFLALPVLLYARYALLGGIVGGAIAGFVVPTIISGRVWMEYLATLYRYLNPSAKVPGATEYWAPRMPAEIEGLTNIASNAPFSDLDSTVSGLLLLEKIRLPAALYLGLIAVAAAVWFFWTYRDKRAGAPLEYAMARMVGLVLLADLLVPIRRLPYSDVILVPIVLLLVSLSGRRFAAQPWCTALIALAILFGLEIKWFLASLLVPPFAIVAFAVLMRWRPDPVTSREVWPRS